jgi:hypothetical protein
MQNSRGKQKIRLAYVLDEHDITDAIDALATGLERFHGH